VAKFKIVVTAGDGIGPEVIAEGVKVLKAIGKKYGHTFDFRYELLGGSAIDATGEALTKETLAECNKADAVLLGAVGWLYAREWACTPTCAP
jgi:3-isopropylmalate dehydrogenase